MDLNSLVVLVLAIHSEYVSYWAYVPFYCRVLCRWEAVGLIDFVSFRCHQKAIYVMNTVIMIVIQEVSYGGRIDWAKVFCLSRSQYRKTHHVCSCFEGLRLV